ncbi:unnamed protein product [Dovyalis caffra]|uniref:Uncharacterized protein n=1 Tax=Dovyalis caffra TaxID=77055 RepID=A0AAV1SFZ6_9ROSI|nr:unnamed protein product [Dovyalis caffra]
MEPEDMGKGKVIAAAAAVESETDFADHHFIDHADSEEEFSDSFLCCLAATFPVSEEEKKMGCFSQQFGYKACNTDQQHHHPRDRAHAQDSCSFGNGECCANMQQIESAKSVSMIQATTMSIPNQVCDENCSMIKPDSVEDNSSDDKSNGNCKQSFHPRGLPKVCLEFDHFLEEQFPAEYALRREAVQAKQPHVLLKLVKAVFYLPQRPQERIYHGGLTLAQRFMLELAVILVG